MFPKTVANNCINTFELIAENEINALKARAHTAQQEQPKAPKKPLRSAIGSLDVHAPA